MKIDHTSSSKKGVECPQGSNVIPDDIPKLTTGNLFTRDFVLGFLAYFVFLFACFALIPTLPIYLARLGSDERGIGILVGVFSVSSLVSRLLVGGALFRYSEKSIMKFAALLFAVTFPACIVFRPFFAVFCCEVISRYCVCML